MKSNNYVHLLFSRISLIELDLPAFWMLRFILRECCSIRHFTDQGLFCVLELLLPISPDSLEKQCMHIRPTSKTGPAANRGALGVCFAFAFHDYNQMFVFFLMTKEALSFIIYKRSTFLFSFFVLLIF